MNVKASVRNYEDAAAFLGTRQTREIAHNTRVERVSDPREMIVIRYHDSIVVMYSRPNGADASPAVTLYAAGWMTKTTKDRLNAFVPHGWSVSQERGQWALRKHGADGEHWGFADGITIDAAGRVTGQATLQAKKAGDRTSKAIRAYVKQYAAALVAGKVPAPSAGDCWYCLMREVESGKPWGEGTGNTEHLENHMEESYFVPSLLVRAAEMYPLSPFVMGSIGQLWQGNQESANHGWDNVITQQVESSLSRYMKHCLNIAA